MPLGPVLEHTQQQGRQAFFKSMPHTLLPSEAQLSELDALEEVVFVGYPNGMFEAKKLMPILRRGTTATAPQLDYEGSKAFLADASVFPGSSGRLVLIRNQGSYSTKQRIVIGTRVLFLGGAGHGRYARGRGRDGDHDHCCPSVLYPGSSDTADD